MDTPLRYGLKTEKAQRKLVEALKAGRPKRGAKTSAWFRTVSRNRKAKLEYLKKLEILESKAYFKKDRVLERYLQGRIIELKDDIETCSKNMHCSECKPDGDCDRCETIDGIVMEVVNNYASTCDHCHDLTMHVDMKMDPVTQFGYCPKCVKKGIFKKATQRDAHGECLSGFHVWEKKHSTMQSLELFICKKCKVEHWD